MPNVIVTSVQDMRVYGTTLVVGQKAVPNTLKRARELARACAVERGDKFAVVNVDGELRVEGFRLFPPKGSVYNAVPTEQDVWTAIARHEFGGFLERVALLSENIRAEHYEVNQVEGIGNIPWARGLARTAADVHGRTVYLLAMQRKSAQPGAFGTYHYLTFDEADTAPAPERRKTFHAFHPRAIGLAPSLSTLPGPGLAPSLAS